MNLLLDTNSTKIIALDDGESNYLPAAGIAPIAADVYWYLDGDDPRGARFFGRVAIGETVKIPYSPLESDAEPRIIAIPVAPDGLRGFSDLRDGVPVEIPFARMVDTYAVNFGDGAATSFTITHNLESDDLQVEFRLAAGTKESVSGIVWAPDATDPLNKIGLTTTVVPALNELRVIIKK